DLHYFSHSRLPFAGGELGNRPNFAEVFVGAREMEEQVAHGGDIEPAELRGTSRADPPQAGHRFPQWVCRHGARRGGTHGAPPGGPIAGAAGSVIGSEGEAACPSAASGFATGRGAGDVSGGGAAYKRGSTRGARANSRRSSARSNSRRGSWVNCRGKRT